MIEKELEKVQNLYNEAKIILTLSVKEKEEKDSQKLLNIIEEKEEKAYQHIEEAKKIISELRKDPSNHQTLKIFAQQILEKKSLSNADYEIALKCVSSNFPSILDPFEFLDKKLPPKEFSQALDQMLDESYRVLYIICLQAKNLLTLQNKDSFNETHLIEYEKIIKKAKILYQAVLDNLKIYKKASTKDWTSVFNNINSEFTNILLQEVALLCHQSVRLKQNKNKAHKKIEKAKETITYLRKNPSNHERLKEFIPELLQNISSRVYYDMALICVSDIDFLSEAKPFESIKKEDLEKTLKELYKTASIATFRAKTLLEKHRLAEELLEEHLLKKSKMTPEIFRAKVHLEYYLKESKIALSEAKKLYQIANQNVEKSERSLNWIEAFNKSSIELESIEKKLKEKIKKQSEQQIESDKKLLEEIKQSDSHNTEIKLTHLLLKTQIPTSSESLDSLIKINAQRYEEACELYKTDKEKALVLCKNIIKSYIVAKRNFLTDSLQDIESLGNLIKEFKKIIESGKIDFEHNRYSSCKNLQEVIKIDEIYISDSSNNSENNLKY